MSKRRNKKQRFTGIDPAVAEVMTTGAVPNRAAMTAKQRRDMKRKRAAYDIDPTVKAVVEQIAHREDTSASQVAEMFLAYAVRSYLRGESELQDALNLESRTRSRTPRFYWDLHLPGEWLLTLEAYLSEARKSKKWGA